MSRPGLWRSWNGNQRQPARERYPFVYPGLLSFGYGLPVGYGFAAEDGQGEVSGPQQNPQTDYGYQAPDTQLAEVAPPLYRAPYQGSAPTGLAAVHPQPATVLIFTDGRPQQLVHNYALLGTTLWALDGETRQEIPLAILDLPATVKANRAAGVDFALPGNQ